MSDQRSLFEARGVTKIYGALTALNGVDLSVRDNEFHGLIGPNGSGKSTLLKCIAGAEIANAGTIRFLGIDIGRATPAERARAGLSLKFQIASVLPNLSVYDNILLALQAQNKLATLLFSGSRRALDKPVTKTLAQFRLEHRKNDLAGVLSHGEQQWLEIAMALAGNPKLLLLDEPTAGMSAQERSATGELLAPIKQICSLLIVEHDLDFIKDICDTLTVLDQGQVVASGPIAEVQSSAKVREAYLNHA
jgi:branched-chain amino acid transport system ATP-binding protein